MSEAQYPADEFDQIARNLPQGAHRPGQPWWQGFLPFVIAIIAAPLLAWALLLLGSQPTDKADNAATESPQASPASTDTVGRIIDDDEIPDAIAGEGLIDDIEGAGPDEGDGAKSSAQPSEAVREPDKAVSVTVFNASKVNGLAAQVKEKIDAKGYTKVTATNYTGTKPAQTTIYYDVAHQGEAKEIQQILQIDMLVERAGTAGVQVVLTGRL